MRSRSCHACATEIVGLPDGGVGSVHVAALSDAHVVGLQAVIDRLCPRHRAAFERFAELHRAVLARAPS